MSPHREPESGDLVDDVLLFLGVTKALARRDGFSEAYQRGSGLFVQLNRTPEALASLSAASEDSAAGIKPHFGWEESYGHAEGEARKSDVARWWICTYPSIAPPDNYDEDEYYSPEAVRHIVERSDDKWAPADRVGD